MDAQEANKPAEKSNPKTNTTKPVADQAKVINQLRQEIKNLNKTIKDMQKKPDIQAINIAIPRKLLSKVNRYLLDYAENTGEALNISDFISDAIDVYLWAEEDNKRLEEEERKQAEKDSKAA